MQIARDLARHALLHLEPARVQLDQARDLAQSRHAARRHIRDVALAEERHQVMLAHRVEVNIAHEHQTIVRILEDALGEDLGRGGLVTTREMAPRFGDARRRVAQLRALRVSIERRQERAHRARERVGVVGFLA
jgi:hypothetical protein